MFQNLIKDIHSAAVDNDLEFLKLKTAPPIPNIILSGKDINGLTALHKAAGLAHTRLVEYLLSIWPNAATETDFSGRSPLHWAASAKNNDRCFNLLVQAGADETSIDHKLKLASYYKTKPSDIDRSLLTVIPEAPRIPQSRTEANFDWSCIGEELIKTNSIPIKKAPVYNETNNNNLSSNLFTTSKIKRDNSQEKFNGIGTPILENTSEPDLLRETPISPKSLALTVEEEAVLAAVSSEQWEKSSKMFNTQPIIKQNELPRTPVKAEFVNGHDQEELHNGDDEMEIEDLKKENLVHNGNINQSRVIIKKKLNLENLRFTN